MWRIKSRPFGRAMVEESTKSGGLGGVSFPGGRRQCKMPSPYSVSLHADHAISYGVRALGGSFSGYRTSASERIHLGFPRPGPDISPAKRWESGTAEQIPSMAKWRCQDSSQSTVSGSRGPEKPVLNYRWLRSKDFSEGGTMKYFG